MKIKIYTAVCSSESYECWFTVNGGSSPDRDEAIRIANGHSCLKNGKGKIERIDIVEVDEEDWYSKKSY